MQKLLRSKKLPNLFNIILHAFLTQGYDESSLIRAQIQASKVHGEQLFASYDNPNVVTASKDTLSNVDCFFLILRPHSANSLVQNTLRQNYSILGTSGPTTLLYHSKLICGARRNPGLRDRLVKSIIPLKPKFGKTGKSLIACDKNNSNHRSSVVISEKKSTTLCRGFMTKKKICCKSNSIIYCPSCTVCGSD